MAESDIWDYSEFLVGGGGTFAGEGVPVSNKVQRGGMNILQRC